MRCFASPCGYFCPHHPDLTRCRGRPIAIVVLVSAAVTVLTIETIAMTTGTDSRAVEYASYFGWLAAVRGRRFLGACAVLVSVTLLLIAWAAQTKLMSPAYWFLR